MEEEVQLYLDDAKEKMQKAITHFEEELSRVRAGKANPSLLNGITVDYYGTMTPLSQVSNINTPDARTISVQPWEKGMIEPIEKAILAANIGLTPINNGELIRINIPVLTEERRKDLVKIVRGEAEGGRVAIRNIRRDANNDLKALLKDKEISEDEDRKAQDEIQKLTDAAVKKVDEVLAAKEKELMEV